MELELVPLDDNQAEDDVNDSRSKQNYKGIERRKFVRRTHEDRRDMVRFEEKNERRAGKDRRAGNVTWNSTV